VGLSGVASEEALRKAVLSRVPKGTEELNMRALDLGLQAAKEASGR
jgi:2-oxoglutarate ferredoxin oxidoreductase subunit gamma